MLINQQQHKAATPTKIELKGIPSGSAGLRATLKEMTRIVSNAKKNISLRELALSIVAPAPPKCWSCEAKLIHQWVQDNIRYVRDIHGIETIAIPEKTLEYRQGDCDDLVVLAATLLQTVGHPVRFLAVGFHNKPISHVLLETLIGNKWIPMELTEPMEFGKYPPGITSQRVANIKL